MPDADDGKLEPRVDKLEDNVKDLKDDMESVEGKMETVQATVIEHTFQIGRLVSHVESEVGLARNDLGRIETRLFGKDDEEYGGKIGYLNRRVYRMEVWFLGVVAAAGIIGFGIMLYQFLVGVAR